MTGETPAKRLLGNGAWDGRGGGMLPSIRTHYPLPTREALHALAESNPKSAAEYEARKAEILAKGRRKQ